MFEKCSRACLKNHSCNLHAPICGIFCLHSVDVARYAALIQAKSPTNCNAHLTESIFQTRSRTEIYKKQKTAVSSCLLLFYFIFVDIGRIRACLKNHSCNLHAPIYSIFCLHSVAIVRYADFIQAKSLANCDAYLAESIFQTPLKVIILSVEGFVSGETVNKFWMILGIYDNLLLI